MSATDLEDLLKEKVLTIGEGDFLQKAMTDESLRLRKEGRGLTISQVFASNPKWINTEVNVLSNPVVAKNMKSIEIEKDEKVEPGKLKIVYFDAYEVLKF